MSLIDRLWYGPTPWLLPLLPLEKLFIFLATRRQKEGELESKQVKLPVPVVIVGNISVGGVGKTPFVVWLVELLQSQGYRPGVVSRGYGGTSDHYPLLVDANSEASQCGDEPLMIALRTGCPVVVDPDRVTAAETIHKECNVDIVISDDGLQHYRLPRDIEIAVVDGKRGLGNGHCLPVGPLREYKERLDKIDFCVVNGLGWQRPEAIQMLLKTEAFRDMSNEPVELAPQTINAVAGIGNPNRFFDSLREQGFEPIEHSFPDHHDYSAEELYFDNEYITVMTEKDAVKCRALDGDNRYYLPVSAELPETFREQLLARLKPLVENR